MNYKLKIVAHRMINLKIAIFFIGIVLFGTCNKEKVFNDMYATCGTSYETSELFFTESQNLVFNLRFVYFADSLNEVQPDYASSIKMMNDFFEPADISFRLYSVDTFVESVIKRDMPSFVKYHLNIFKDDRTITCYVFDDFQPNYSDDLKHIAGSSGGNGSTFFAIKRGFVNTITMMHEFGHSAALFHTFVSDPSPNGYTIFSGDRVCDSHKVEDTDPTAVDSECNYVGQDKLTEAEKKQVVCNFMSWSYSKCRNCMTNGQIRRMRFYIHESPQMRNTLYSGTKRTEI